MTTLEKIFAAHAEAEPHLTAMKEYSVKMVNLSSEFIAEQVNSIPQANFIRRTLVATLDPTDTPRSNEAQITAFKSQWPEAVVDAVLDVASGKVFVFVQ